VFGIVHTAAVGASMFVGSGPEPYYLLYGTIEITCTVLIVIFALRWKED
jgi:hypothetical protein